jgi:hypothetical protein
MNEPVAPENSKYSVSNFKFVEMNVIKDKEDNDIIVFNEDNMTWFGYPRLTLGIDGASAESKNADDTALVQVGISTFTAMMPGTNQVLKKTIAFVYDARGGHYDEYDNSERYKKGFIDEADRMVRQAHNICTAFEVSGQQAMQYRELCRAFAERGLNLNIVEAKPSPDMKKEQRINSVMSPIVGVYNTLYINSRAPRGRLIMSQLCTLGAAKHDDYADGAAIAFSYVVPNNQEYHKMSPSDVPMLKSLTSQLYRNREQRKGLSLQEKLKRQKSPWAVM